jgi:DNA-binding protein H-NS
MKSPEKMTLKELTALSTRIDRAMDAAKKKEVETVRAEAEKLANAAGMTLADLFGKKRTKHAKKPRIVNPLDKSQSWSGLGRKPVWLKELEANA